LKKSLAGQLISVGVVAGANNVEWFTPLGANAFINQFGRRASLRRVPAEDPAAYAQMQAAGLTPETVDDTVLAAFAGHYFESALVDEDYRVALERVRGSAGFGTYTFSSGLAAQRSRGTALLGVRCRQWDAGEAH
jgi:hypothetical protein